MANIIINCQNVDYHYLNGNQTTHILKGLNFKVIHGESIAILGQSGCGKSTLLNLLGGMDKPQCGKIFIHNKDITKLNEEQITKLRAQHLGFVYQRHHLLKDFNALKNVMMPLLIQGTDNISATNKATLLLTQIGLKDRMTHFPSELSGGECQRVAIARALIQNPSCILADEPTGNLTIDSANKVIKLMLSANQIQNCALVVVTHDEKIAAQMDKTFILNSGTLTLN